MTCNQPLSSTKLTCSRRGCFSTTASIFLASSAEVTERFVTASTYSTTVRQPQHFAYPSASLPVNRYRSTAVAWGVPFRQFSNQQGEKISNGSSRTIRPMKIALQPDRRRAMKRRVKPTPPHPATRGNCPHPTSVPSYRRLCPTEWPWPDDQTSPHLSSRNRLPIPSAHARCAQCAPLAPGNTCSDSRGEIF